MDDIPVIDPEIGKVPLWKSILWNTAKLRNALARADSADGIIGPEVTPLTEGQQTPPLAADEGGTRARARTRLSDEELKQIEDAVDALDQRLSQLEARRDAEQKLLDLEAALEATGIAPEEEQRDVKLN
jgi:hypothetical protein